MPAKKKKPEEPKDYYADPVTGQRRAIVFDTETIEYAAGLGLTLEQVQALFRLTPAEWAEVIKNKPELGVAINRGRSLSIFKVATKLMEKVETGNLDAIKFYLKTKGGYAETGETAAVKMSVAQFNTSNDPVECARIYQQIMKGEA